MDTWLNGTEWVLKGLVGGVWTASSYLIGGGGGAAAAASKPAPDSPAAAGMYTSSSSSSYAPFLSFCSLFVSFFSCLFDLVVAVALLPLLARPRLTLLLLVCVRAHIYFFLCAIIF